MGTIAAKCVGNMSRHVLFVQVLACKVKLPSVSGSGMSGGEEKQETKRPNASDGLRRLKSLWYVEGMCERRLTQDVQRHLIEELGPMFLDLIHTTMEIRMKNSHIMYRLALRALSLDQNSKQSITRPL